MEPLNDTTSVQAELAVFMAAFIALIPSNPTLLRSSPIYLAVQAKLHKSGLHNVTPLDILYEVWLSGVKSIERGNSIKNPAGWIYTVALRVIARKVSRKPKEPIFVPFDSIADNLTSPLEECWCNDPIDVRQQKLLKAMEQLSDSDQELLVLSVVQGLSYAEIYDYHVLQGKPSVKLEALRQQKNRALKKLRAYYQQLD